MSNKAKYRIQTAKGTFKNAGTDLPSWFDLDSARSNCDYSKNERIVEHDGVNVLWEIL